MRLSAAQQRTRKEWAESVWTRIRVCMGCGRRPAWYEVHEMERRSQAPKTWAHPCNYLLLCRACHAGPFATMEHAEQLAHKLYWDKEHFDLEAWLRLKDKELVAPRRVTLAEVLEYMWRLVDQWNNDQSNGDRSGSDRSPLPDSRT